MKNKKPIKKSDEKSFYIKNRLRIIFTAFKQKNLTIDELIDRLLVLYLRKINKKKASLSYEKQINYAFSIIEEANKVEHLVDLIDKYNFKNIHLNQYMQKVAVDNLFNDKKVAEQWVNIKFIKNQTTDFDLSVFSKGVYRIVISHKSHDVFENRKALMLFFGCLDTNCNEKNKLFVADKNGESFCYMGGGMNDFGIYTQDFYLKIDEDFETKKMYFYCSKDLVIDNLIIQNCSLESKNNTEDEGTGSWDNISLSEVDVDSIDFILYADINVNVVDGSSIWYSSMMNILSNRGNVAVILKENPRHEQVLSNILNKERVVLISPKTINYNGILTIDKGVELVRKIDDKSSKVKLIVVRGCEVAFQIHQTRQFYMRSASYITDFYSINKNRILFDEVKIKKLGLIALRSTYLLTQTYEIEKTIQSLVDNRPKFIRIPPPIDDEIFELKFPEAPENMAEEDEIKIGYAGKINPYWGVLELFDYVRELRKEGFKIKLFIAANKISSEQNVTEFRKRIIGLFEELDVTYYNSLNRKESLSLLSSMDYVWCFRPGDFESNTLELSTKLVESIAIGSKSLCYPANINLDTLGADYPYFMKDIEDFRRILLTKQTFNYNKVINKLSDNHALSKISDNLHKKISVNKIDKQLKKILFASHDFKFIDAYISYLKSIGYFIKKEHWEWGGHGNETILMDGYKWSDVIFCEWGLANAVWYSKNNIDSKPLYIRMHAQEVRARAQKFGKQIETSNVEKIIFVSENIKHQALELFGYDPEKTIHTPNFVMEEEFFFRKRCLDKHKFTIGILGIVPNTKRLDRAVFLLEALRSEGLDVILKVKGHRPENLEFMKAPSRSPELEDYYKIYKYIDEHGLTRFVEFEGWGANVSEWYGSVDFILSPSENESFHYALADGVLSGCLPVVWDWKEADTIYPSEWIVNDLNSAVRYTIELLNHKDISKIREDNRKYIIKNYGNSFIFSNLNENISH